MLGLFSCFFQSLVSTHVPKALVSKRTRPSLPEPVEGHVNQGLTDMGRGWPCETKSRSPRGKHQSRDLGDEECHRERRAWACRVPCEGPSGPTGSRRRLAGTSMLPSVCLSFPFWEMGVNPALLYASLTAGGCHTDVPSCPPALLPFCPPEPGSAIRGGGPGRRAPGIQKDQPQALRGCFPHPLPCPRLSPGSLMAIEPTFSRCARRRVLPELSGASNASFNPLRQTAPRQLASLLRLGCLPPARPREVLDFELFKRHGLLPCASSPSRPMCGSRSSQATHPAVKACLAVAPSRAWPLKWSLVLVLVGGGPEQNTLPTGLLRFPRAFRNDSQGSRGGQRLETPASCSELRWDSPFPSRWPSAINQEINNLLPPSQKPPLPFPVESPACLGTSQSGPPRGGPW